MFDAFAAHGNGAAVGQHGAGGRASGQRAAGAGVGLAVVDVGGDAPGLGHAGGQLPVGVPLGAGFAGAVGQAAPSAQHAAAVAPPGQPLHVFNGQVALAVVTVAAALAVEVVFADFVALGVVAQAFAAGRAPGAGGLGLPRDAIDAVDGVQPHGALGPQGVAHHHGAAAQPRHSEAVDAARVFGADGGCAVVAVGDGGVCDGSGGVGVGHG